MGMAFSSFRCCRAIPDRNNVCVCPPRGGDMNRLFFYAGTILATLILIVTVAISGSGIEADENVEAGFALWQTHGCESCHTLYGQGGNYAPDLTHIYTMRGDTYLRDFIVNPAAYHPDARVMPKFNLTQTEFEQLISLFEWTASTEPVADVWPPDPILVSGSAGLNIRVISDDGEAEETLSPLAVQGRSIYSQRCASCHSVVEDVVLVGPSFWNIANHGAERVEGEDAESYIRNSILYPSDYIVPGFQDVMQSNFAEVMSSQDIDAMIAYLMTFDANNEGEVQE